jgi:hypothetical protein
MLLPSDNPFLLPLPDLSSEDTRMLDDILPKDILTETLTTTLPITPTVTPTFTPTVTPTATASP